MSIAQYCLSWDSYKNNVCNGFTDLQQNGEFVDMTLAADGHFVKVHKSIFALASPYIRSMLQSTPNQHPIIFFDVRIKNVSPEVLNYILSYVYTGEVSVELDKIEPFMRVAKELRLCGLFGLSAPKVGTKDKLAGFHMNVTKQKVNNNAIPRARNPGETSATDNAILTDSASEPALPNIEELDAVISAKQVVTNDLIELHQASDIIANEGMPSNSGSGSYLTADGYQYKLEIKQDYNQPPDCAPNIVENTWNNSELMQPSNSTSTVVASIEFRNDNAVSTEDNNNTSKTQIATASLPCVNTLDPKAITPLYTMSNRGSLQLILNRYMYYCHHHSHGGRKRRWRCIDYRSEHCPAFVDTDCELLTVRKFGHAHAFHDEKIRKKMKRDLIFTNLNVLEKMSNKKKGKEREEENE